MKVLYGVQGTGNGHITRARAMADEFRLRGIDVDFVFSGRAEKDYFDMDCFGQYRTFTGLSFAAKNGKINLLSTCRQANIKQFFRDVRHLDLSPYDLILSDFEPVTSWAAKRAGRECIGIGHQYAFGNQIPKYQGNQIGVWILNHYAPATLGLGVHWHHFHHDILPPIIQTEGACKTHFLPCDDVLVYLPFENSEDVLDWLEGCPEFRFRLHCKDIVPGRYGNVEVYSFSREGFQRNLHECDAVLCNAGFELNSEALQLGRRIMVKPLHGQVEQLSNAVALQALRFASTTHELSSDIIAAWLSSSRLVQVTYPNVAKAIVNWLLTPETQRETVGQLCEQLWSRVESNELTNFVYTPSPSPSILRVASPTNAEHPAQLP